MEPNAVLVRRTRRVATVLWLSCCAMFGLAGPIFLSIFWAGEFEPREGTGYPWPFPAWSYGITLVKTVSLVFWMGLGFRSSRPSAWLAGMFAGVFLVGGGHALACGIANNEAFDRGYGWHVVVAYLAALAYLGNFVLALLRSRGSKGKLLLGLSLGLLLVACVPGAVELLAFGPL